MARRGENETKVLRLLSERKAQFEIAKILKISRGRIAQIVGKFKAAGIVRETFGGATKGYEITPTGMGLILSLDSVEGSDKGLSFSIRSHNIKLKFAIERKPPILSCEFVKKKEKEEWNWESYEATIKSKYGAVILEVTTKSVVAQLPIFYTKSTTEASALIGKYAHEIKQQLELNEGFIFKTGKKDYEVVSHIITQHHGLPNHPFSALFEANQFTGSTDRVMIDHSHGEHEVELISPKYAMDDMDTLLQATHDLAVGNISAERASRSEHDISELESKIGRLAAATKAGFDAQGAFITGQLNYAQRFEAMQREIIRGNNNIIMLQREILKIRKEMRK